MSKEIDTAKFVQSLENKELVICFHCGANVPKEEAFYITEHDTYLCEKDYLALLEGKPIRLSNWRTRGV